MTLVYSNIHIELTAQVKGAAKIMVTVVTTQELEAGDVLRRFEAEAAQHEPHDGNTNNCSICTRPALGNCIAAHAILLPHSAVFLFFHKSLAQHQYQHRYQHHITAQKNALLT